MDILIEEGAPLHSKDHQGQTILHYAVIKNTNMNVIKLLLDKGL